MSITPAANSRATGYLHYLLSDEGLLGMMDMALTRPDMRLRHTGCRSVWQAVRGCNLDGDGHKSSQRPRHDVVVLLE